MIKIEDKAKEKMLKQVFDEIYNNIIMPTIGKAPAEEVIKLALIYGLNNGWELREAIEEQLKDGEKIVSASRADEWDLYIEPSKQ